VSDREVVLAKALVAQQKRDKAKLCLQKKKFQEQLIKRAEYASSSTCCILLAIQPAPDAPETRWPTWKRW